MKQIDHNLQYTDPSRYDKRHEGPLQRYVDSVCQPIIQKYFATIRVSDTVCDLGSGTFHYTALMPAKKIYAVEINSAMIQHGLVKITPHKDRIIILQEDAAHTSIPTSSCDVVWSMGLSEYMSLDDFLAESARILRPGGRLIFQFQNGLNPNNFLAETARRLFRYQTKYYRRLGIVAEVAAQHQLTMVSHHTAGFFCYVPARWQWWFIGVWRLGNRLFPALGVNVYCEMRSVKAG